MRRPRTYSGARGPGTLVVTVGTSGCLTRKAACVPSASHMGAAKQHELA